MNEKQINNAEEARSVSESSTRARSGETATPTGNASYRYKRLHVVQIIMGIVCSEQTLKVKLSYISVSSKWPQPVYSPAQYILSQLHEVHHGVRDTFICSV